jgi:hypothetical protein
MPSNKNIFIPQVVFNVQGMPVLFGVIKIGILKKGMTITVDKKTLKIIKIEQGPANLGVSLSDLDITQAQSLVNKELEFFEIK